MLANTPQFSIKSSIPTAQARIGFAGWEIEGKEVRGFAWSLSQIVKDENRMIESVFKNVWHLSYLIVHWVPACKIQVNPLPEHEYIFTPLLTPSTQIHMTPKWKCCLDPNTRNLSRHLKLQADQRIWSHIFSGSPQDCHQNNKESVFHFPHRF